MAQQNAQADNFLNFFAYLGVKPSYPVDAILSRANELLRAHNLSTAVKARVALAALTITRQPQRTKYIVAHEPRLERIYGEAGNQYQPLFQTQEDFNRRQNPIPGPGPMVGEFIGVQLTPLLVSLGSLNLNKLAPTLQATKAKYRQWCKAWRLKVSDGMLEILLILSLCVNSANRELNEQQVLAVVSAKYMFQQLGIAIDEGILENLRGICNSSSKPMVTTHSYTSAITGEPACAVSFHVSPQTSAWAHTMNNPRVVPAHFVVLGSLKGDPAIHRRSVIGQFDGRAYRRTIMNYNIDTGRALTKAEMEVCRGHWRSTHRSDEKSDNTTVDAKDCIFSPEFAAGMRYKLYCGSKDAEQELVFQALQRAGQMDKTGWASYEHRNKYKYVQDVTEHARARLRDDKYVEDTRIMAIPTRIRACIDESIIQSNDEEVSALVAAWQNQMEVTKAKSVSGHDLELEDAGRILRMREDKLCDMLVVRRGDFNGKAWRYRRQNPNAPGHNIVAGYPTQPPA